MVSVGSTCRKTDHTTCKAMKTVPDNDMSFLEDNFFVVTYAFLQDVGYNKAMNKGC